MAIYTYRCVQCDKRAEVVQSIKSYCVAPEVPDCHGAMERYLTAPLVAFDTAPWAAYQSPIDGSVITSRRERNEHMARHGVVMYDEIKPDIERNAKAKQQAAFADLKQDIAIAATRVESGHKPQVIPEAELIPTE